MLTTTMLTPVMAADFSTLLSPAALAHAASPNVSSGQTPQAVLSSPAIQAQLTLSAANLARAANDLSKMTAAQAAASASSQLTLANAPLSGSSWNGSALSGLNPRDSDPTQWINADPLQKNAASATATVKQTAANALLTWQSFDLNKGEKLIFDQQGNADWSVLNRVVAGPRDASGSRFVASPSMILGSIQAPGSVYVINPNGVVFGPTAQINVHSLIASSLDVGSPEMNVQARNSFFLNTGILGSGNQVPAESFSYNPDDRVVEGDIVVQAGAQITASLAPRSVSPDAGGFVYLFAPNVINRGTITTPAGETLMVAAQAVQLIANVYPDGFSPDTRTIASDTFRAVGVNTVLGGGVQIGNGGFIGTSPIIWRKDGIGEIQSPGQVTNTGLINAERGTVILNGDLVTNGSLAGGSSGVIRADTSITRNGQIYLDARLQLTLANGSVQSLPADNGETVPVSALSNFVPGKIELRGYTIDMEPGALIEAPGASVQALGASNGNFGLYPSGIRDDVTARYLANPQRIYLAPGSAIDVSGLQDVALPVSGNFLTFKPFGNEFADQPLQRDGALRGLSLTVDLRQTGTLNGVSWVGTPLANLAGYVNSAQLGIGYLLTTGGNITLSTDALNSVAAAGEIVLRQGSSLNAGGGTVQYTASTISASRLLDADGHIVNIARANPQDTYLGVAGTFDLLHPHWGNTTTESFFSPVLTGLGQEPGYSEGHDAGAITLLAKSYILNGDFFAGVSAGERQRASGLAPGSGSQAMPNAGSFSITGRNDLVLASTLASLALGAGSPLPANQIQTTFLSTQTLSDAGFAKISATFSGHLQVASDADLTTAPGGAISLTVGSADIEGKLVARSGTIQVDSTSNVAGDVSNRATSFAPVDVARVHQFDLTIGSAALLDVSGLWVNDNGLSPADAVGGAFVGAGSITLRTESRSAQCFASACKTLAGLGTGVPAIVDLTGDIILSPGALLDVSSGGRITNRGLLAQDSSGRAAGKGGNVTLGTYFGNFSTAGGASPIPVTTGALMATIRLPGSDGSAHGNASALAQLISAYGLSQGGALSLRAPSFDIGADPSGTAASGAIVLAASFFDGNAFGSYNLTAVGDHLNLAANTSVTLRQRNFVADSNLAILPTGAKLSQAASLDFLPDVIRQPVNLSLSAVLPVISAGPYDPALHVSPSAVALLLDKGASIQGDPGAKISISVTGRTQYDGASQSDSPFPPAIASQEAVAELLGTISAPGGNVALNAGANAKLWLGANSRLDVSGEALTDSRQTLFRAGTVLAGGSVAITGTASTSLVVGLQGALIDVSGGNGVFDLLADAQPGLSGPQRVATSLWSDAGSVTISAPNIFYDGSFDAHAGASAGIGGSFSFVAPRLGSLKNQTLTVRQGGNAVPQGLAPTDPLGALTAAGATLFNADWLNGSGFHDLTLAMGFTNGDVVSSGGGGFAPGKLVFSGNVNLGNLSSLVLDASQLVLSNTVAPIDPRGCNVCLDASYVALRGAGNIIGSIPTPGNGKLQVSADTIDIAAGGLLAIFGAAQSNFISTGDIRLRVPLATVGSDLAPGTLPTGELITAGDLGLTAAQIYPMSNVDFTLKSIAPNGTIRFAANGKTATTPLSAGAQLTVSAATINQGGILLAPLGTIRLGAQAATDLSPNDPATRMVATQTITFAPGSVTSVSLNGQTVPFGETLNGTSWSYDSITGRPLTTPPVKSLTISAAAIDLAKGATLDLRGGGDLVATEFVPGTGGSRDVLANNPNAYAILPGYDPAAAPIDLDFLIQRHDALPSVGSKVYLSGEAGIAAGFYTLLPAYYATLPGAYLVTKVGNSADALSYQNFTLPDGTLRMAGYLANGTTGTRDARLQDFDVQSSAVWRQYSEIDQTSANSFFGAKTSGPAGTAPRLPVDAGRAVFSALTAISLQGSTLFAPGANGRTSELDIVAQDIQVVSPGAAPLSGYVGLDATQLSNLGVDSLLLGGTRSDDVDGELVTVVSNSVEISNDASTPLTGPEIILVTGVSGAASDPNASRRLLLDVGSVVSATGPVTNPARKKLIIGSDAQEIAGSGSLLAVSNISLLDVDRQDVNQTNGLITLAGPAKGATGAGPSVSGNSLVLDTSGLIRVGTSAPTLSAANMLISAKTINFGTTVANAGFNINGAVANQLQLVDNLVLRSEGAINFSGPVTFSMGAGSHLVLDSSALVSVKGAGDVTLGVGTIDLINSGTGKASAISGGAKLTLTALEIDLGSGAKSLGGFGSLSLAARDLVALRDSGSLDGGSAAISFQTPLLLVGANASQSVTTSGDVSLTGTGAAASAQPGEVGGTLALTGRAIALGSNADLRATAGGVTLTAASGDIVLGTNAKIEAGGFVSSFFDVDQIVGGGAVQLVANQGAIDVDPTALIDVSSPAGRPGYAGQIILQAANGNILSAGRAFNMAIIAGRVAGDSGGRLTIDAQSLGAASIALPGMFDAAVDLHLRQGDIQLASGIQAASVAITVDGGVLTLAQTINTSGEKGGSISLFGQNGVVLARGAQLLATASDATKRGGDIVIGTQGSGVLDLQSGLIDVSNTANPASGGTVRLRAPLIGPSYNDVAINPVNTVIRGASNVTVEGYRVFKAIDPNSPGYNPVTDFNGVIDPAAQPGFFGGCTPGGACSGTLINFVQNFALSASAQSKFVTLAPATLHLQPGIELVNDNLAIKSGDITVASAWNLGSGVAGYLVSADPPKNAHGVPLGTVVTDANGNLLPQYASYNGRLKFVPGVSQITSLNYRVGGSVTGEAGTLTLRAARDVNINASITDGFFQTRNVTDATYRKNLISWVNAITSDGSSTTDFTNVGGYLIAGATYAATAAGPAPLAPYDPAANGISPVSAGSDRAPITGADLFALIQNPSGSIQDASGTRYSAVDSWSYRMVSGADIASANPLSVRPLNVFDPAGNSVLAGHGNVSINGHATYTIVDPNVLISIVYQVPTIVRTGTGSIDIAAGLDFLLTDQRAPGVVYTAGRSSVALPDPGFVLQTVNDPLNPGQTVSVPVATNPSGFLAPVIVTCDIFYSCNPYGPMTQAAYPVGGGHLTLTAQRDIVGFEHPTINSSGIANIPNQQYFVPWLLAQGTALPSTDFGVFSPLSAYISSGGSSLFTPSQTSWWINFGSFDQGLMSVGGDVTVKAGRDIQELSVSLPTTARVSGGLSSTVTDAQGRVVANVPVMHLNGSGDLTVIAGRDLKSGAYYEGSGQAKIIVGGVVTASWTEKTDGNNYPVSTILAVDTGQIDLRARGDLDVAGIVSGPSLQNILDPVIFSNGWLSLSAYGPSSAVRLLSVAGNLIVNSLPADDALVLNVEQVGSTASSPILATGQPNYPGNGLYPVNFSAVSANGDVAVANTFRLASSRDGSLDLLAHGSLLTSNANSTRDLAPISTGASLVEAAFDALNPLAGFAPPAGSTSLDQGSLLLHQNDRAPDIFYAATGDIIANENAIPANSDFAMPLAWEITKPAKVQAGRDIVDLSFFGQNLSPTDVTSVTAGRDIYYTGIWQQLYNPGDSSIPNLGQAENLGGLSLAGPGFFKVQAGRNLGPFVTAASDVSAAGGGFVSDPIGTGIVTFGNTVVVGNRRMFSNQVDAINSFPVNDQFATGTNNNMARQGADIVALFGVANGIDYASVIKNYVDPDRAVAGRDYIPSLQAYLQTLNYPALSRGGAWTTFETLPTELQQIFADKVFLSELKLAGDPTSCCYRDYNVGYSIVNALFNTALGYTDNNPVGGGPAKQRATGDLDLLHAVIKTLQSTAKQVSNADGTASAVSVGGNVIVLGPGGSINVGATSLELRSLDAASAAALGVFLPLNRLSNSSLGILTLDNGAISIFTDVNVQVNQSRILTVQGGDIMLWSSNGNLDAGRGAKTTVDFKPLSVDFDPSDLQTINLNGLVSGAGIGTIRSTPDAPSASTTLIAPRGIVNAGDAGLRSSGNLDIAALLVLNAANIAASGSVSGVPQSGAVNISALESASSSGGQAARIADDSVAATANRGGQAGTRAVPSLITVEVLGFGDCDPEGGKRCPTE